jgi:hypothetical protein
MPRAATPISAAMRSGSWIKSRLVPVNFAVANRGMGADMLPIAASGYCGSLNHPTCSDLAGKVSSGATLAVSRRLGHRQLRADSCHSRDWDQTAQAAVAPGLMSDNRLSIQSKGRSASSDGPNLCGPSIDRNHR